VGNSYRPLSLMPASYEVELHALDIANGIRISTLADELEVIKTLVDPYACPSTLLPYLASVFGADFFELFSSSMSDELKRKMVGEARIVQRKKGTVFSLKKAFESLGVSASVEEWYEYDGEPYRFRVLLDSDAVYDLNSIRYFIEKNLLFFQYT